MLSILVAEDEPAIRDMLDAVLTSEGYEMYLAANGDIGVALAVRRLLDAALLDLMPPLLDGASAARTLCGDQRAHLISIVSMSTNVG